MGKAAVVISAVLLSFLSVSLCHPFPTKKPREESVVFREEVIDSATVTLSKEAITAPDAVRQHGDRQIKIKNVPVA